MQDLKQDPFVSLTFHSTASVRVKICIFPFCNLQHEHKRFA